MGGDEGGGGYKCGYVGGGSRVAHIFDIDMAHALLVDGADATRVRTRGDKDDNLEVVIPQILSTWLH